jgi:hypothetical protein
LRLEESSVKQADIRRERGSQCDLRQASVHIAASPCLGRDVDSHLLNHESLITNHRVSNRHKVPIGNRRNSLKTNDRRLFYPSLKRGGLRAPLLASKSNTISKNERCECKLTGIPKWIEDSCCALD